jgi:tetratricopeptide (TPR) repeat protein
MVTTRAGARQVGVGLALLALLGAAELSRAAAPLVARGEDALRKKALGLNDVTGRGPMKGVLSGLLANPDGTRKMLAVAVRTVRHKPEVFTRNAAYLLAVAADALGEIDSAAVFYRLNAKQELKLLSEHGLANAYGGLIQMYYDHKKYAESEKVCREFLKLKHDEDGELEVLRPAVERRMILALAKQGSVDKALNLADRLFKENPTSWLTLAVKGQVLRDAERYAEAVKVYLSVLEMVKKERRLEKADREDYENEYRYLLSGLYVDLGQIDKASEQLKALLAKDPSNPTYNNDLGFIWADRGINLAEAEKLIRKALEEDRKLRKKINPDLKPEQDRDNAAYLDSLGWVLYRQGKAREARPYLEEAVKQKDGQHVEILDHLGDVYWALGEKAEALAAWRKALEAPHASKRDEKRKVEVEKKLKGKR